MRKKTQTVSPVVTGAAGAVIGASIGAAAGVAMNNPTTRNKVGKVVQNVQKQATDYVKSMDGNQMEKGKRMVSNVAARTGMTRKTSSRTKLKAGKSHKN